MEKPLPTSDTIKTFEKDYVLVGKKLGMNDDRIELSAEAYALCSTINELIKALQEKK